MTNKTSHVHVYKTAAERGLPVVEATDRKLITVTSADVARAKLKSTTQCALVIAASRLPGVRTAFFFRTMGFLEYKDRIERYVLPPSVQKEIVSFDRIGLFAPGDYQISRPSRAGSRASMRKYAQDNADSRNQKRRQQHAMASKRGKLMHRTQGIRSLKAAP